MKGPKLVTHLGRTTTVAQLAREHGLPYARLLARLERGWTVEAALTRPPDERRCCRNALHENTAKREAFVSALAATPEIFTEKVREAVRLAFAEGLGVHGAAARLGLSYQTTYGRIESAGRAIWLARPMNRPPAI
jgi:hypothetical protein